MRARSIRLSLALAMAFFVGGGLPHARAATTELKAGDNGHYVTDAEINHATIRVMVDTGASAVALSYEDADDAGLHPGSLDFNVPISTANGQSMAARVVLRSVKIDGVGIDDVEGLVLPEGAMQGSLLGMSFLGRLAGFRIENGVLSLKN
jgi:aspartyl protease family protein